MTKCPMLAAAVMLATVLATFMDYNAELPLEPNRDCGKESCALWDEYFERCSFAVGAHIKGIEDKRRIDEARARA